MGEVIFLDHGQNEIVKIATRLLNDAQQDDVACVIMTEIDSDGSVSYSRAGTINNGIDALKLIGAMEHHKEYLMRKMNEIMAAATEFREEEETE
jgi:iron uptake system EfeUOB component EfeO/EfeM